MPAPSRKKRLNAADKELLWPFLDAAEQGEEELAQYLQHCGITAKDIAEAGDVQNAVMKHYRLTTGSYDIGQAAEDLSSYPSIAKRIRELRRERRSRPNG